MDEHPDRYVAVIDDDAAVLDSLRLMLEVAGYRVATFDSAQAFCRARAPGMACLILDHQMPGMTGLDLAARLRTAGEGVPTLLITGQPTDDLLARAATLGIEKVLIKPLPAHELLDFAANFYGSRENG